MIQIIVSILPELTGIAASPADATSPSAAAAGPSEEFAGAGVSTVAADNADSGTGAGIFASAAAGAGEGAAGEGAATKAGGGAEAAAGAGMVTRETAGAVAASAANAAEKAKDETLARLPAKVLASLVLAMVMYPCLNSS